MCTACRTALDRTGYVTIAGMQVQENYQVPTCYPGVVYVIGEQYPPDAKKWDKVLVPPGSVTIDHNLAVLDRPGFERPQKSVPFDKDKIGVLKGYYTPRFAFALVGIACSGARPMMSANTSYNKAKALFGRVYRTQDPARWGTGPAPAIYRWAEQFHDLLGLNLQAHKMPLEEWVESMPSRRRKALRLASVLHCRTGWMSSYATFCAFVKSELLPGFAKRHGDIDRLCEMTDRLIQGPNDVTHVVAGPWLKPLVHQLKTVWTWDTALFYGSNTPESLHNWLQRLVDRTGAATYVWSDFTMFDNTHSRASWAMMRHIYKRAGIDDPDFWAVLDAWEQPSGRIGPLKYRAAIMNASGRDDTSLANGVLNGVATTLALTAAWLRKPLCTVSPADVAAVRSHLLLSVAGDDSLGCVPLMSTERMSAFLQAAKDNLRMFGFTAKMYCSTKLYDAVYLGMRPYPTVRGWFWGKTIGRATYKMGWAELRPGRDLAAHVTGVADMHVLCSLHVPVLADLALRIRDLREGQKRTPVMLDENKPWEWTFKSGVPYDHLTLAAVADTYSVFPTVGSSVEVDQCVTVEDVLDLVNAIRRVETIPCVLDHWLWRRMILVDDL